MKTLQEESLKAEINILRMLLTNLANASAIIYSHTADIGKYQGGSGESARALMKKEMESASNYLTQ